MLIVFALKCLKFLNTFWREIRHSPKWSYFHIWDVILELMKGSTVRFNCFLLLITSGICYVHFARASVAHGSVFNYRFGRFSDVWLSHLVPWVLCATLATHSECPASAPVTLQGVWSVCQGGIQLPTDEVSNCLLFTVVKVCALMNSTCHF